MRAGAQPLHALVRVRMTAGDVRHIHFGEGDYGTTEQLIRDAHSGVTLPPPTDVPSKTPAGELSPETYVGYEQLQYLDPDRVTRNTPATYHFPASLPLGALGLSGTTGTIVLHATPGVQAYDFTFG